MPGGIRRKPIRDIVLACCARMTLPACDSPRVSAQLFAGNTQSVSQALSFARALPIGLHVVPES